MTGGRTGTSVPAGTLSVARADHAAARLLDGRVLIVGGSDGNAPLAIAEIFDPATGSIAPLPASLATPRMKLSATTLLDGHVLVAGGNDGVQDLATAEIFDAELGIFWATSSLHTPRSGHVAMLLPNNNTVLIAGGMSNGVPVASVERFAHWIESEMFYADSNTMAAARTGAVAVPTARDGVVLVGGGGSSDAEFYGFATVKTDKLDYAPYETVTISGSGWQPGETVRLRVTEDSDSHYDWVLEAIADDSGNVINRDFYPRNDDVYHSVGMRFYVTAVGIASQAEATFTDAMPSRTNLTSSLNPSPAGQSVTFTATVDMNEKHGNTDNWQPAVGGSVKFYDRTTATAACDQNNGNYGVLLGTSAVSAGQATFSYAFPSGGTYPIQACYRGTGGNDGTQDSFSPVIAQSVNSATVNTATTASNASAT
ncbi:MAG TPA: hypothetical protein VKE51_17160, partial [Vicinamibacterales bacterium]|nr:hypothetical protein [Vicinamibacterales bacterium]